MLPVAALSLTPCLLLAHTHAPAAALGRAAGDLNVAPEEIDIHNPKGNLRSPGFTVEERQSFARELVGRAGLVDTFRRQYPGVVGFTYWGWRTPNARWGVGGLVGCGGVTCWGWRTPNTR